MWKGDNFDKALTDMRIVKKIPWRAADATVSVVDEVLMGQRPNCSFKI